MTNNDIINQLEYFITNELRMPTGLIITVIEEIERLRTFVDQWHQARMQLFGQINLLEEELSDAYDACRYALANSPRWEALAETVVHTWEVNHGRQ